MLFLGLLFSARRIAITLALLRLLIFAFLVALLSGRLGLIGISHGVSPFNCS